MFREVQEFQPDPNYQCQELQCKCIFLKKKMECLKKLNNHYKNKLNKYNSYVKRTSNTFGEILFFSNKMISSSDFLTQLFDKATLKYEDLAFKILE